MSIGMVKRLSVLACVLMLPMWILGGCLVWLVDFSGFWGYSLGYFWYYGALAVLALLILGGVCGRPRLTRALCGLGLALFLLYVLTVCLGAYGLHSGAVSPYLGATFSLHEWRL